MMVVVIMVMVMVVIIMVEVIMVMVMVVIIMVKVIMVVVVVVVGLSLMQSWIGLVGKISRHDQCPLSKDARNTQDRRLTWNSHTSACPSTPSIITQPAPSGSRAWRPSAEEQTSARRSRVTCAKSHSRRKASGVSGGPTSLLTNSQGASTPSCPPHSRAQSPRQLPTLADPRQLMSLPGRQTQTCHQRGLPREEAEDWPESSPWSSDFWSKRMTSARTTRDNTLDRCKTAHSAPLTSSSPSRTGCGLLPTGPLPVGTTARSSPPLAPLASGSCPLWSLRRPLPRSGCERRPSPQAFSRGSC
ncbi:uncharacterized protein LOC109500119 isoform X2 [Felis catus]|uniref:uncharacterized protein LOC109500119 isoform X2 n=1 Tax=Felis catus TaxID=9685 RepID=UPI001D19FC7C|nr:uncharacterized protein LOC109500119 isoform X2 [Felis catus]